MDTNNFNTEVGRLTIKLLEKNICDIKQLVDTSAIIRDRRCLDNETYIIQIASMVETITPSIDYLYTKIDELDEKLKNLNSESFAKHIIETQNDRINKQEQRIDSLISELVVQKNNKVENSVELKKHGIGLIKFVFAEIMKIVKISIIPAITSGGIFYVMMQQQSCTPK